MARPISNRFKEVEKLYVEGLSVEDVAERTGYATITTRNMLSSLGLYDPPLTRRYLDKIWPEWEKACDRIRGEVGKEERNEDDQLS